MITIPVAVSNNLFKWQSSLFQYAQKNVYGNQALWNSIVLIADRNSHGKIIKDVDWNLSIPYKIVNGIHTILPLSDEHPYFSAGNLFFAIKQILNDLDDNEYICIIDCDVIPFKKYDGILPNDNEVVTCDKYETWHMKCSRPDKENYRVVEPYLKHDTHEYMDGGFVPIIIKVKTLKQIIDEVIEIGIDIARKHLDSPFGWWQQMWSFQIACHNNRIKCIGQDNTYFPNINDFNREKHYFAHYSCDPIFKKSTFPNHNITEFPNNDFYNLIKDWFIR